MQMELFRGIIGQWRDTTILVLQKETGKKSSKHRRTSELHKHQCEWNSWLTLPARRWASILVTAKCNIIPC